MLNAENQDTWPQKASQLSQRELEKEIVKIRPLSAVLERATLVTETRIKLELGLSENDLTKLRQVQTLLSQSRSAHASLEDIPAHVLHQVNLRDQRKCTHINSRGEKCNQDRWVEIHHKVPVQQGGKDTLDNLTTLCSAHHQWIHSEQKTFTKIH